MSYATPALYINRYGLAETLQMLADEQGLLTEQLLLDVLAGTWTGSPSAAEQAAATAALARLQRELAVSSNMIDGYLRTGGVVLPLPAGHADSGTLEACCLDLTRCGLADDSDNATDRMDARCGTWRAWLKDVAAGRASLAAQDGSAPQRTGGVRGGQGATGYDWTAFGGVR